MRIRVKIAMKECGVCPGGKRSLAGKGPLDRSFQAPLSVGKSLMSEPERAVQEGKSAKGKFAPTATGEILLWPFAIDSSYPDNRSSTWGATTVLEKREWYEELEKRKSNGK